MTQTSTSDALGAGDAISSQMIRRVTFLTQHFAPETTGNAPYAEGLASWLDDQGVEVTTIATHPHYPEWRIWPGFGQWRLVRPSGRQGRVIRLRHFVPATPSFRWRFVAETSFGLRSVAQRWGSADVALTLSPGLIPTSMAVLKAKLLRRPVAVWVQDIYSAGLAERTGLKARIGRAFISGLERSTLDGADVVIAIHDRFARVLTRDLGVRDSKVVVVRNWTHIDIAQVGSDAEREEFRRERGWGDEFIVLHAGNQGAKQGLEFMVKLARALSTSEPQIRFVLLGQGNQHDRLREMSCDLANVEFLAPLPDGAFANALVAADALLVCELPQSSEAAVPSKLTSYFAAGTPVLGLLNPAGITAEELLTSEAGLVVDNSDLDTAAEDFVTAVKRIANELDLRARLSLNAREFVRTHLDREAALERLWAAVESACVGARVR